MNTLQQPSGAPLFLEPLDGNGGPAIDGVSAATSLANRDVSDNQPFWDQREFILMIHAIPPRQRINGCVAAPRLLLVYDCRRWRKESADQLLGRRDRRKQPGGVEDKSHFRRNVDESGQKRIQKSKS